MSRKIFSVDLFCNCSLIHNIKYASAGESIIDIFYKFIFLKYSKYYIKIDNKPQLILVQRNNGVFVWTVNAIVEKMCLPYLLNPSIQGSIKNTKIVAMALIVILSNFVDTISQ